MGEGLYPLLSSPNSRYTLCYIAHRLPRYRLFFLSTGLVLPPPILIPLASGTVPDTKYSINVE